MNVSSSTFHVVLFKPQRCTQFTWCSMFLSTKRNLLSFSNLSAVQCIHPKGKGRTQATLLVHFNHTRWTSLGALNLKHPWAALSECRSAARNKLSVEHCKYAVHGVWVGYASNHIWVNASAIKCIPFHFTAINKCLIYKALPSQF